MSLYDIIQRDGNAVEKPKINSINRFNIVLWQYTNDGASVELGELL